METLGTLFLAPFPPPQRNPFLPSLHCKPRRRASSDPTSSVPLIHSLQFSDPWSLSDGNSRSKFRPKHQRKKPLSDDDARRIIKAKARYLSELRRNQGSHAQTPRWIRRTPEQMARYIEDDRDGHLYGNHVVAAIQKVRALAGQPEGSYDIREVMGSFVTKLTFREMCVVLKEQRGWRQVRDFFGWMKLQLCYRPSVIVYTIILRSYGQVGKIKLAEQIFLEMLEVGCEPDEVACGTMLCAYARWGRHKDMLIFYNSVRRRKIVPAISVFNFMISSLQKKKQHEKVTQLWGQMLETGIVPNSFTYTVVINSYVKQDLMHEALEIFGKMRKSGFISEEATYSLLISITVKNGDGDQALKLYEDMKSQGIVPSNYTFASLLTLHYKNGDYSKALSLFSEMERNKISVDEVIYGIIIRIYGKLGLYEDAEQVFQEVENLGLLKDERTYAAIAQVYLASGNYAKALCVFELMRSRSVEMSAFAYSTLLRCFVVKEDVDSAEATFHILTKFGVPDAVACNELLLLYVRLGLLEKARAFIIRIRTEVEFDEDLYRTVLQVYCKEKNLEGVEQLLEEMENKSFSLDKYTKTSLMALYGEAGGLQKAEDFFKSLDKPDLAAFSVMLSLYLENRDTSSSKTILKSLLAANGGCSTASQLISKFAREGNKEKACSLYGQVIELGSRPSEMAMSSLIDFHGRRQELEEAENIFASVDPLNEGKLVYSSMIGAYVNCGKLDEANCLYKDMVKQGLSVDVVSLSVLVNALTRSGKFHEAEDIILDSFQGGFALDTVAYNTYIKSMLESGKLHFASDIFSRMIHGGVPPTIQTYNTMISVYDRGGTLDKAIEMFNTAQSMGFCIDEKTYSNMINCYGKAGKSREASLLFHQMQKEGIRPGKISYNIMINVYATNGFCHEASNLFQDMTKDGIVPDSSTYLALVQAYVKSHQYAEAENVISKMQGLGIVPSCSHFNLLIGAFTVAGFISDAERVYSNMKNAGLHPDLACCRRMLRMYVDYGLVDEGLSFFEEVKQYVRPDAFLYSAVVHFYEYKGNGSRAEELRLLMDEQGLLFHSKMRVGSKAKPS